MSLEYVTGTEFILANDSILIFVLNTDQLIGSAHILIYQAMLAARFCSPTRV